MKYFIKKLLVVILFIALNIISFSNDWEFGSRGEHIAPLETSGVSIKKENIRMKLTDDGMNVYVRFVFDSPVAEKKIIGFITPEGGFENYEWNGEMNYSSFSTKINGKAVSSNVEKMKTFYTKNILSKEEIKKYKVDKYKDSYVYYFNADFKKGENIVEHSYTYSGSGGVGRIDFEYILTTISKWKNKKVDEFEIIIEPEDKFITLPYTFWNDDKRINWEVIGEGKMDYSEIEKINDNTILKQFFVKLKNGYVRFRTKNFSPDKEFNLTYINDLKRNYFFSNKTVKGYKFMSEFTDYLCCYRTEPYNPKIETYKEYLQEVKSSNENEKKLEKFSNSELRILKNYPYAIKGYDFSSKDLKDYFSNYMWYYPITKDIKVDKEDLELGKVIDKILEKRKKR